MRNLPNPPRPTVAASVAVATTWSTADRNPDSSSGNAHGTSTLNSTSRPVIPIPRAASRAAASTCATPAYAPAMIGGTARTASTSKAGARKAASPSSRGPRTRTATNSSPRLGIARSVPAVLTTRTLPRPVWPTQSPAGTAITAASASAAAEYQRCSTIRAGIPSDPCHCTGSVSQLQTASTSATRPLPGRREPGRAEDDHIEHEREQHAGHQPGQDRVHEVALEPVGEQRPELADADDRCDADDAHVAHRGHPQAGGDDRDREWQLHRREPALRPEPHGGRRRGD